MLRPERARVREEVLAAVQEVLQSTGVNMPPQPSGEKKHCRPQSASKVVW